MAARAKKAKAKSKKRAARSSAGRTKRAGRTTHTTRAKRRASNPAIDLLEQDHREVEGYFADYQKLDDEAAKEALAKKICLALKVHAQIEEEIFYPQARETTEDEDLVDESLVEHGSAKHLIEEIEAMSAGDALYDAKVKVLGEMIKHHVQEEEEELFPECQRSAMDFEALGRDLSERKRELMAESSASEEV